MATSGMEGVYVIPRDAIRIKNELQQVLNLVVKVSIFDKIKQNPTYKYSCRVVFLGKLIRGKIRGIKKNIQ